jgi:IS1 family transposase
MWHFIGEKSQKLWIWKAYSRSTGKLIDWEFGNRDRATLEKLLFRLNEGNIFIYLADHWAAYGSAIAPNMLYQSKASTLDIERNNGRQRHWLARFRRSSIVVTKSLPNLDALMTLFARFRINGTVSEFMRMIKQGTIYL